MVHLTHWVPTDRFTLDSHYMTFVDKPRWAPVAYFLERLLAPLRVLLILSN